MSNTSFVAVYAEASPAMRAIVAAHALGISMAIVLLLYGRDGKSPLEFANGSSFANLIFHAILIVCYGEVAYMAGSDSMARRSSTVDKIFFFTVAIVVGFLCVLSAVNAGYSTNFLPASVVAALTLLCLVLYLWRTLRQKEEDAS